MQRFKGQSAVITGGTSGIGLATGKMLAAEGAHVILAGRDTSRGVDAVAAITEAGGDARFVRADVANDKHVDVLARGAAGEHGQIDIWFNNAGTEGIIGDLEDVDDAAAADVINVNFKGVYSGIRHAARYMEPGATIINNASFVGTAAHLPIAVAYGGTKAAVVSMTRSAAAALSERKIRVLAVCPYIVDTPMVDRLTDGAGPEARADFAATFAPSGQLTGADEVAELVTDLCDGRRTATTGDAFLIDANRTVTPLNA